MTLTVNPAPDTVTMEPGQSLRTAVDAGAWLQVVEGRARMLSPPSWFGETLFMTEAMLAEGDVHRLERGGWIEVTALHAPVSLRIHAPYLPHVPAPADPELRPVMRLMRLLTG
ncbi:hypothetical protein [Variovorax sp.]|uniref:hypothetical protein n=1 Tax=Variovorax sp. TaxID=1871043 RepID=UPI003BAC3493